MTATRCAPPKSTLIGRTPSVAGVVRARLLAGTLLVAVTLLPACSTLGSGSALADLPPAPERPRDPWVLRCVLDEQPRMLVIALDDDLWLAYDTTTCTLAKAWRGDVDFDGPVYTTAHGPQPTSRGEDLHDPLAGSEWLVEPGTPVRAVFRGYTLSEGRVALHWEIPSLQPRRHGPQGPPYARVTETPEVTRDSAGRVGLVRRFEVRTLLTQTLLLGATGGPEDVLRPTMRCSGNSQWELAWDEGEEPRDVGLQLGRGTSLLEVIYAPENTP